MKRITTLVFVLLMLLLGWGSFDNPIVNAQNQPERALRMRVSGTLLPRDTPERDDIVTVKVYVHGTPWMLRVGAVEDLTQRERKQVIQKGILRKKVRFLVPDELSAHFDGPNLVGRPMVLEGRLYVRDRRFVVTSVEERGQGPTP